MKFSKKIRAKRPHSGSLGHKGLTSDDPKQELVSKLEWTYKHLPFLMAYYARATLVTFCALPVAVDAFGKRTKMCRDLIQFDTSRVEDRLHLVLACINLAKLLKTMETVCEGDNELSDMPLIWKGSGKIFVHLGGW
jgi:hypothetical protein